MAVRFSELIADPRFGVKSRRSLKALYGEVWEAVKEGRLNLEGHSLPTTMNAFIEALGGRVKPLAADSDVVDFSIAEDEKYEAWAGRRLGSRTRGKTTYVSAPSRELLGAIQELERAREASMLKGSAKKEEVLSRLSDLQAATSEFLSTYEGVRHQLKLPDYRLDLSRVKVRGKKERA
jgi:hypothetical protein